MRDLEDELPGVSRVDGADRTKRRIVQAALKGPNPDEDLAELGITRAEAYRMLGLDV